MSMVVAGSAVIAGVNISESEASIVAASPEDTSIISGLLYGSGDIEVVTNEMPIVEDKRMAPITAVANAAVASAVAKGDADLQTENTPLPAQAGNANSILLATSTLVRNDQVDTEISYKPPTEPFKYKVKAGDTVSTIATKYGVDTATILTENKLFADEAIKAGQEITILPVAGATERVDNGEETIEKIAEKHGVSKEEIIAFNELEEDGAVHEGQILVVPDGKREVTYKPQPVVAAAAPRTSISQNNTRTATRTTSSNNSTPVVNKGATNRNHGFQWGWCTWYVAEKRGDVNWRGNAGTWLNGARRSGRATGAVPAVGSIMVTSESGYGHVAYVEAVNGDQITVSEMNYKGFGVVSRRTLSAKSRVIKGFVY